jgi:TonB-dependent receptor
MNRRISSALLCVWVLCIFGTSKGLGQERKGTITGRVTDANHAVLQGAQIAVQPNRASAASDEQGQFAIYGVTPGRYTVTISAVGFATFSQEVDVAAGGAANLEAVLEVGKRTEVVEVRGERQRGEVEALNRERTADNIVQVLPSEVITSLPNTNIADAVGRLPSVSLERDEGEGKYVQIRGTEPRLSNVTVDGVHLPSPESVRNVKLDAIPADLVDSVEISKTLSANQEGDAIGGSVNLVTKSATDKPYLSVMGMGGFTPIAGGRSLQQFSANAGQRFGPDHRFGILIGGSYDWNGRGIDDIEPSQAVNPLSGGGTFLGPNAADLRQYWYDRTRYGFGGTLDYKISNNSSAYLRGLFSQFKDDGQDWIYSPSVGSFATPTLTNPDGSSSFSHVTRKPAQRLFSFTAGARHDIGATLINYELSFGQARFTGFFPSTSFDPVSGGPLDGAVQYAVNTSNPFVPKFTALNANIFDPNQYVISRLTTGDDHTFERDVTGAISVARTYTAGTHFSTIEVGAKVRDAHKSQLNVQQTFSPSADFLMSSVLGSFTNPDYYFGKFGTFGPTTDYKRIVALFNANPGAFDASGNFLSDQARTLPADFNTDERVAAGYVMNTINFGNARVQAGVRIEGTQDSFIGNQIDVNGRNFLPGSLVRVPGEASYVDVLPSVQFQYRLGSDTLLRAAYGMGISRPNFGDLPPFVKFDPTIAPGQPSVTAGNPNLKPTHAQNFDFLIERYLKNVGIIQGGVFYKYLTDPIYENVITPITTGQFAGQLQSAPINGPRAHITGIEMTWQQRLTFLPGLLNGSGIRANYSYTSSNASFPAGFGRTDHVALLRQAPNNWNFDFTYDKKGISARMGLTHNDANIFAYQFQDGADGGIKGPQGDQYLYPHTQVDAQVSYWIPRGRGLQAIVSLLNVNNEVFGFYNGSEQFPVQREYYSRTVSIGLRWTAGREHPIK